MGGIDRSGNWKRNAQIAGGTVLGLGGALYGLQKAYKAYDKANIIKEMTSAMGSPTSSPILQMLPIY